MNLIDNAIKHNEAGGRVTVGASAEGGQAVLTTYSRSLLSRRSITQQRNAGARARLKHCAGDILLVESGSQWTEFYLVLPLAPAPDPAGNEDAENESSDREGSDQEGRFAAPHLIP